MKLDKLGVYLELDTFEIYERIKRIEKHMKLFLIETESQQIKQNIYLDPRDIRTITAIAKNCCNNINLINQDCLLEIILLYYYIMDILHEDHSTQSIENFFGIRNFTSILINNIQLFSKPYVVSNMKRKINQIL